MVLIVAKCNVNGTGKTFYTNCIMVLIVAKCNVNSKVYHWMEMGSVY